MTVKKDIMYSKNFQSLKSIRFFFVGFHDAIGDAITLSLTPKHLQGLGLIQKSVDDTAHDINFLFAMAMDKVR